jgi:ABC-2 type transport system permease protein
LAFVPGQPTSTAADGNTLEPLTGGAKVTLSVLSVVVRPRLCYLFLLLVLVLSGMILGALGLLLSSTIRQLENFAGVMNFVIFPMFFASSALYPLWRVQEANLWLWYVCEINPFTHATELIRFALYGQVSWMALAVVVFCLALFMTLAVLGYDPSRGMIARRGGAE